MLETYYRQGEDPISSDQGDGPISSEGVFPSESRSSQQIGSEEIEEVLCGFPGPIVEELQIEHRGDNIRSEEVPLYDSETGGRVHKHTTRELRVDGEPPPILHAGAQGDKRVPRQLREEGIQGVPIDNRPLRLEGDRESVRTVHLIYVNMVRHLHAL